MQAVQRTMTRICKCHGVSGSCTTQTCWMRISEFKAVGNYLKRAYRKATKVESNLERNDNSPAGVNDLELKTMLNIPKSKLAFSEDSPDYCIANATLGSNGTVGRQCSQRKGKDVTKEERRSCKRLCTQCKLKVQQERRRVLSSCLCKFKFCCEVECQTCAKEEYSFACSEK